MKYESSQFLHPTMSGTVALANSQKEQQQTAGTCFLRLDEQLLECFHVYCTTCCSQLITVAKDGDEESENECKVVLQCPTCQCCRDFPPKMPTDDGGSGAGCDIQGQGIFQDGLLSNHSLVNLVDVDVEQLSCELFSVITKQMTTCRVKKTAQNVYEVSCVPHLRGEHQLRVRIDGEHVRGSPFAVITRVPVENIGKPIVILQGLKRPWGVVVKHDGEMLVAEHYAHCVSICNTEGKKKVFATYDQGGRVAIADPRGIALDHQGNLLIVDGKLCCVQKFTVGGKLIAKVGSKGEQTGEFKSPIGIGIHPHSQKVYIADNANHRIQVLNSDFTFCRVFGTRGSGNGELNFPWDVAFDSFGYVYVVDSWNNRVQVFTEDGQHLRQFGQKGNRGGKLLWPSSICIDVENFVYITEAQNHRVSVFTSEGEFVTSFGSKGTQYGEFVEPTGIAVDRYRVVYVSDSGNDRLQLF